MSKKRSKNENARKSKTRERIIPTLKKVDYMGLSHKAVKEKINPNVEFVCYMSVTRLDGKDRAPVAVYLDPKPDRSKNHSDYMLIGSAIDPFTMKSTLYITGRSQEQINKDRIHNGTMCLECGQVLVSLSGHHFHSCECPNDMFVDGGQYSYTRIGAKDLGKTQNVKVDMLTGEIKLLDKSRKRK